MNMKYIKHIMGIMAFLFGLLVIPATTFAAPNANGTPPVANDFDQDFPANTFGAGSCPFPINITWHGKGKTITLPGNRLVVTSPGLKAEFTNLDTLKTVQLNITGAFHITTNGTIETTTYTGQNLFGGWGLGLILTVGNFSWAWDGGLGGTPVQPLLGNGKQIDICALIS